MKEEERDTWLKSLDLTLRWLVVSFLLFAAVTTLARAVWSDIREFKLTGPPKLIEVDGMTQNTD